MKFRIGRFNTYLSLLLILSVFLGCRSDKSQKRAPKKGYGLLRLHLEVNPDGTDKNGPVTIGRAAPFSINVTKVAFVDEAHLAKASIVEDAMGGFQLKIQLTRQGAWLLDQYTLSNKGKRIAVFAQLEDFRWLGAPLITRRLGDGIFTFTPDATREETEKLVLGLNKMIKKLRGQNTFNEPEP